MTRFIWFALISLSIPATVSAQISSDQLLDTLQHSAFSFFWNEANPSNGLIKDRSASGAPCSIASVGFGLTAICIGADHGWITRTAARDRVLTTLKTFWTGPQGQGASGYIGYKGFFFHFLDMTTAQRTWNSELSTIDSGLLFAGILDAKQYFDGSDSSETAIRNLADSIYRRADWEWFRNLNPGLLMGWMPGTQFAGYGPWAGYNEAMIMYILAYGSPTHAITDQYGWLTWISGYSFGTQYGYSYVIFPPLFGHQYSHCWIDYRGIRDAYMRNKGFDYFENSRRAALAQRAYCAVNPGGWAGYSDSLWGITASDDPTGYSARGAPPPQSDNGTLVPTAPISSIAFAPAEVMPAIWNMWNNYRSQLWTPYGFRDAFNIAQNWWDSDIIGIDQGPIIIMIENHRTGRVWNRFMLNADIQRGLQRTGFQPVTDVEAPGHASTSEFFLEQNYPNPFNPVTTFTIYVRQVTNLSYTSLQVYDVLGRSVATLVDGTLSPGIHTVRWDASVFPTGIYIARLKSGKNLSSRKLLLLK